MPRLPLRFRKPPDVPPAGGSLISWGDKQRPQALRPWSTARDARMRE